MSANTMRFVADALYHMISEDVALEGAALKGLHEIIEDHVIELQKQREALERDHAKAEVELQRLIKVLFGSGAR